MSLSNPDEEIICNFTVSKKRKRVWRVQLDMVKVLMEICNRHGLKCFASGGTLIGAVRHSGYIPWDDDIDLMMPRSDYEKLIEVAPAELPEKYFLQCSKTEKNYPNGHLQIRDNTTTCFLSNSYSDLKSGKNCGIFIDVFPYDVVPDDYKKRKRHANSVKKYKRLAMWKVYGKSGGSPIKRLVKAFLYGPYFWRHNVQYYIEKAESLAQKYNSSEENTVALITFIPGYEKNVWKRQAFDKTISHDFEDMKLEIPLSYDEVLKKEFGDYMQIPEDKGGTIHGGCYFDFDKSYKDYAGCTKEQFNNLMQDIKL